MEAISSDNESTKTNEEKASIIESNINHSTEIAERCNSLENSIIQDDSAARIEDEDFVLEYEPAKEQDGDIDEDELLKDTDIEDSLKKVDSPLQCSESSNNEISSNSNKEANSDHEVRADSLHESEKTDELIKDAITEGGFVTETVSSQDSETEKNSLGTKHIISTDMTDIVKTDGDKNPILMETMDIVNDTGNGRTPSENIVNIGLCSVLNSTEDISVDNLTKLQLEKLDKAKETMLDNPNEPENKTLDVTVDKVLSKSVTNTNSEALTDTPPLEDQLANNEAPNVTSNDVNERDKVTNSETITDKRPLKNQSANNEASNETSNDNNEKDNGTSFEHVDQDSNQQEDEIIEASFEDPFAQTTDIPIEVSDAMEKETDQPTKVLHNADSMDADDNSTTSRNLEAEVNSESTKTILDPIDVDSMDADDNSKTSRNIEAEVNTESTRTILDSMDVEDNIATSQDQGADINSESTKSNIDSMEVDLSIVSSQEKEAGISPELTKSNDNLLNTDTDDSNAVSTEKNTDDKVNSKDLDENLNTSQDETKGNDSSKSNVEADNEESSSLIHSSNTPKTVDGEINVVQSTVSEDEPAIIDISNVEEGIEKNSSEIDNSKNESEVSIVSDTNKKETISISKSLKIKTGKQLNKLRNKSRQSTPEESSEDSDLGPVEESSLTRPKRNAAKKAESQIRELSVSERQVERDEVGDTVVRSKDNVLAIDHDDIQTCHICKKSTNCKVNVLTYGKLNYFCDDKCFTKFRDGPIARFPPMDGPEIVPPSSVINQIRSVDVEPIERLGFVRKCAQCSNVIKNDDEKTLSWETMDFCTEECLGKYQQELGSFCANCKGNVQAASLGKYCVRFGYEVKQFCCSNCLEEFKKGLKVCSFCQKDISSGAEGFLAPVGDKGTFKDFCTQSCMEKYEQMSSNQPPPPQMHPCDVCKINKIVELQIFFDNKVSKLCSEICFTAYKFANMLTVDCCDMCKKYFDKDAVGEKFNIFYDGVAHNFCCKTCMNVYILAKRKIVPCNWCKVKKYNFDMIKRVLNTGQVLMMCSINCLTLYNVSVNAVSSRRVKCDNCQSVVQAQYHLTMSDASIRNFCKYPCVMSFQQQYNTQIQCPIPARGDKENIPIPTGTPKRIIHQNDFTPGGAPVPIISNVGSLANGPLTAPISSLGTKTDKLSLVTTLVEPPTIRNKGVQTRPNMVSKSVGCEAATANQEVQTDSGLSPILIPIPVPIYVPIPLAMYSLPFPVPAPFPIPIPVPIFLPTTRNSHKGIMEEFKKIVEKTPDDPLEAELLMMADMVAAADKKPDVTSSESEAEADVEPPDTRDDYDSDAAAAEPMDTSGTYGEDILQQIALTMSSDNDDSMKVPPQSSNADSNEKSFSKKSVPPSDTSSKRPLTKVHPKRSSSGDRKKRKNNHSAETSLNSSIPVVEDVKPDVNLKLKYTFGVNAWKSWIAVKNVELEKLRENNKNIKLLKDNLLQLTADELNYSLCLFVKEVKKPNGTEYAPDTVYYLCLGIQQYLFENGRIDNIFTDECFEKFTDTLDGVAKKFNEIYNDQHYIVTRVEEEHLWESKQLGAHSPHVLLSTLMFFNTKHFNLVNVDEHLLLSFSHIMKHWKRGQSSQAAGSKSPGGRNVLLRFYPPQSLIDDPNSKKKKMYEQQENEEDPLRCPVKLYEFYLSKCPDSVKTRNDVFYLQPERSCVPDSPVWYSTYALGREPLEKMLNRVKMIKEINVALLTP